MSGCCWWVRYHPTVFLPRKHLLIRCTFNHLYYRAGWKTFGPGQESPPKPPLSHCKADLARYQQFIFLHFWRFPSDNEPSLTRKAFYLELYVRSEQKSPGVVFPLSVHVSRRAAVRAGALGLMQRWSCKAQVTTGCLGLPDPLFFPISWSLRVLYNTSLFNISAKKDINNFNFRCFRSLVFSAFLEAGLRAFLESWPAHLMPYICPRAA